MTKKEGVLIHYFFAPSSNFSFFFSFLISSLSPNFLSLSFSDSFPFQSKWIQNYVNHFTNEKRKEKKRRKERIKCTFFSELTHIWMHHHFKRHYFFPSHQILSLFFLFSSLSRSSLFLSLIKFFSPTLSSNFFSKYSSHSRHSFLHPSSPNDCLTFSTLRIWLSFIFSTFFSFSLRLKKYSEKERKKYETERERKRIWRENKSGESG